MAGVEKRADIIRFGVDGWQARFDDSFTEENVARVADALALVWADARPGATVYVGYDTRHDAADHARLVAGVLASYGLVVKVSEGPCPTPVVAWTCARDESAVGCVVLTASERSCEYGGIMLRGADGGPVSHETLEKIEQAISLVPTTARGAFESFDETLAHAGQTLGLSNRYIFWRIRMPYCRQGILAGTVLAFARALGEYGATSMIAGYTPGRTATISTTVYQLGRTNDDALAFRWVMINMAISAVVLLAVNMLERKRRTRREAA